MSYLPKLEALPDPGDRFTLVEVIGTGVCGTVSEIVLETIFKKIIF